MTHRFIYPLLGQNMDFEDAALGAWLRDTDGDDSSVVEASTLLSYHGAKSLKLKLRGADSYAGVYQELPFIPEVGQTVALQFRARLGLPVGNHDLDIYIWEQEGENVLASANFTLSSELSIIWQKFTLLHTVQNAEADTFGLGFYTYEENEVYTDDTFFGALWEPRGATRFDVKARLERKDNESASGEVESLAFAPRDEVTMGWKRLYPPDDAELERFWHYTRQGESFAFWFDRDDSSARHWRKMMMLQKAQPMSMGRGPVHFENAALKMRSLPE